MSRIVKLTLEYDGDAVRRLGRAARAADGRGRARARAGDGAARGRSTLTVAGRTDRGVHALGPGRLLRRARRRALRSVNALLPRRRSRCWPPSEAPDGFSARHDALSRTLPLPRARAAARRRRSSAAARSGGRTRSTGALHACAAALPARTTSRRSRRPRPTTGASSATSSRAGWRARRRRARVLDRGRHVHAPHEPRARRDDARGRAAAARDARRLRAPARRAARAREAGATAPPHGLYLAPSSTRLTPYDSQSTCCASCSPTTTASRPRACRRCAARCSTLAGRRARGDRARRQPLGDRALDHDAPAAVGRGGRLRRRHASATRPTARRSTACGFAALGLIEGFEADADRLRHQPRLQPRRRHHLLGHGRRGARGRRARPAGDRRLPAVAGARDGLPARRALRLRRRGGASPRAWSSELDDVPLPDGHAAQRQRAGRRARAASRSRGSASASTATS